MLFVCQVQVRRGIAEVTDGYIVFIENIGIGMAQDVSVHYVINSEIKIIEAQIIVHNACTMNFFKNIKDLDA